MASSKRPPDFSKHPTIDMSSKAQRDFWTRKWGVSIHQLRAAVRGSGSTLVREIRLYLKERGAI